MYVAQCFTTSNLILLIHWKSISYQITKQEMLVVYSQSILLKQIQTSSKQYDRNSATWSKRKKSWKISLLILKAQMCCFINEKNERERARKKSWQRMFQWHACHGTLGLIENVCGFLHWQLLTFILHWLKLKNFFGTAAYRNQKPTENISVAISLQLCVAVWRIVHNFIELRIR